MQYDKLGIYTRNKRLLLGVSLNEFALSNDVEPATLSNFETLKLQHIVSNQINDIPLQCYIVN